jgi:hypothetical protein
VPTPSRKRDKATNTNETRVIQKDRLFNRGKAMSFVPQKRGISQFPNPPINTGIINQKIITNP